MIAFFIGRFQPFHLGHLKDIKDISKNHLLKIGIGSSNYSSTKDNPFSFEERKEMIQNVLEKESFFDVPIFPIPDINDDEGWVDHVVQIVGKIDIVYTGNSWVKRLFEKSGYDVKDISIYKDYNATKIRDLIFNGEDWTDLVPREIEKYIHKIEAINRIKKIYGKL